MRRVVYWLIVAAGLAGTHGHAQTQFWSDNFESGSPSSGTRTPEESGGVGGPPNTAYFRLTDGTTVNQAVSFTGKEGTFYWAGEDHNAVGTGFSSDGAVSSNPLNELSLTWTGIDISGKTGLSFKGLFAANSTNEPWDNTQSCISGVGATNTDYIIVQYRIDGGPYVDLIRFFNRGSASGPGDKYLFEDIDGDGCGDGPQLTNVFSEFTKTIPATGTTLDLKLNVYSEGNNEEWGIDNFRLFETPSVVSGTCGSASAPALVTTAPSANLCSAGTPSSVLAGTTAYTWSCFGSGGGTNDNNCIAGRGYTVTPSAGANGSISPNTAQVVAYNATPAFTVTPSSNYSASVGGTCGGALVSGTYTTSAVTTDCTVAASFTFVADTTPDSFSFTAQNGVALSSVITSNTITVSGVNTSTPISVTGGEYRINSGSWTSTAGSVNSGDSVTVRHTASAAYSSAVTTTLDIGGVSAGFSSTTMAPPVVNGACGSASAPALVTTAPSANLCSAGTPSSVLAGTTAYTWSCTGSGGGTNDNSCSAGRGYTVTPSAGANGSISPNTAQVVAYNATPAFTVTPNSGFTASVSGSCGGALTGSTYTTNAVTADCTVAANAVLNTSYTATAPGGSVVSTQLGGGGSTCGFTAAGYQSAASVGGTLPAGYAFPHGVLAFTTSASCTPGGMVTLTLTYPSALPTGTKFFKYGPATVGASPTWYEHPATIGVNTITYSVTDNGQGDNDNTPGLITDPAGAAVPLVLGAAAIPTMTQWALMLLTGLVLGLGLLYRPVRHRAP